MIRTLREWIELVTKEWPVSCTESVLLSLYLLFTTYINGLYPIYSQECFMFSPINLIL